MSQQNGAMDKRTLSPNLLLENSYVMLIIKLSGVIRSLVPKTKDRKGWVCRSVDLWEQRLRNLGAAQWTAVRKQGRRKRWNSLLVGFTVIPECRRMQTEGFVEVSGKQYGLETSGRQESFLAIFLCLYPRPRDPTRIGSSVPGPLWPLSSPF